MSAAHFLNRSKEVSHEASIHNPSHEPVKELLGETGFQRDLCSLPLRQQRNSTRNWSVPRVSEEAHLPLVLKVTRRS